MTKERNALKAGLFIILCAIIAIGILIAIKGAERFFEPMQQIIISFPLAADVGGIRPGDDLRIGGFKVGSITEIQLKEIQDPLLAHADVYATLPKKYSLRRDATPHIQTTFTGQSWINIDSVGSGPVLTENERLAGEPAAFTDAVTQLAGLGAELRSTVTNLRDDTLPRFNRSLDQFADAAKEWRDTASRGKDLLSHVNDKVDPIYGKYETFMNRGDEMMIEIRDLLGDTKLDFRQAAHYLRNALSTFSDRLPGVIENFDAAIVKMQKATDSLTLTLDHAGVAMENAELSLASIRDLTVNNRGKLDNIIDSLKTTSDNLKATSVEIRRSPWRLLHRPSRDEQKNFRVINTARQFAEGANELNDAAGALRDALNNPATDKQQIEKLLLQVETRFRDFNAIEKQLWQDVRR